MTSTNIRIRKSVKNIWNKKNHKIFKTSKDDASCDQRTYAATHEWNKLFYKLEKDQVLICLKQT